jgi:hypothetical protein
MTELPFLYLKHSSASSSKIYKNTNKTIIRTILEDGFLRNANTTKNSKMTGNINESNYDKNAGKTIYFEINLIGKRQSHPTFILDISLLMEQIFWLNIGWQAGITDNSIKINPKNITKENLTNILTEFQNEVIEDHKKTKIPGFKNLFTNEVLVKKPVDLHKYLLAINKNSLMKDDIAYMKINYPNVKLI